MGCHAVTARHYSAQEILRSGLRLTIRAARPDDRPHIAIDFVNEVMLVAAMPFDGGEIVIGSACYVADRQADGLREAGVAFTIEEPYQALGIASQLLKHLAAIARLYGITRLAADVLPNNESMSTLFEHSGFPLRRQRLDDVTRVTLALAGPWPPQAAHRFPAHASTAEAFN